jgi:creatinine amidohydrolase/Fe(II)-dependent formamide hydrolase-like protein
MTFSARAPHVASRRSALLRPLARLVLLAAPFALASPAHAQARPAHPSHTEARAAARPASGRILRFADLSAAAIGRLDKTRTVVLLPGAIVEEHGPYLPAGADGVRNEAMTRYLAGRIAAARPGWTVLVFPTVPLGSGSFELIAGRRGFPGSVPVRAATERAVFMDLADALGRQGFRWVFVVHGHGEPNHNRALDLAGDYFHDTWGGTMVHLLGRTGCQPESLGSGPPAALFDSAAARADADSPHAGAMESARVRYLRPDLVPSSIERARDVTAPAPPDWRRVAADSAWPGYVGAPRFASMALGRWTWRHERAGCADLALRLLDGLDERTVPRYADRMRSIPPLRAALDSLLAGEDSAAARQEAWLRRAPARP